MVILKDGRIFADALKFGFRRCILVHMPSTKPVRLQSWIPPIIAWTTAPDVFFIDVPLSDRDIVEFISTGFMEVTVHGTKTTAKVLAALNGKESLRAQLEEAIWLPERLKPTATNIQAGSKIVAHCHGVFLLPDGKTLCVLVGRKKPAASGIWISSSLKAGVDALYVEHCAKVAEHEKIIKQKKEHRAILEGSGLFLPATTAIEEQYPRPTVTIEPLFELIAHAAKFQYSASASDVKLAQAVTVAVATSGFPPSRDGCYAGILPRDSGRRSHGIVSWVPHTGLPSYPEVRWAVQQQLPSALSKPRKDKLSKPEFDNYSQLSPDLVQIQGLDPVSIDPTVLEEVLLDQNEYRNRIDTVRCNLKERGFEAIAWFQPYHIWTEETWGIYFDARKLDDLALSFLDDFNSQHICGSDTLASLMAFGLTYAHELFHARVEAAISWQEITAKQQRYLRYQERVYQALFGTPEVLEEALANWSAWNWFKAPGTQSMFSRMSNNLEGLARIVETSLDLSPPGYREWRMGNNPKTWRTFANQLINGKPKAINSGIGMPIESVITGPFPFDFQPADIPLRFVGSGTIADSFRSHPASFNVPTRRELERALKHFRHTLNASGGKGGHQKWTGPDQRAFILPTRDPVSTGVFQTFLHHVGIDKATYVRQVRPSL